MRVTGHRGVDGSGLRDQAALARTAAALRGTPHLVPRGVYRFTSFEEADAWMTTTMQRTLARLSRQTSPASAKR